MTMQVEEPATPTSTRKSVPVLAVAVLFVVAIIGLSLTAQAWYTAGYTDGYNKAYGLGYNKALTDLKAYSKPLYTSDPQVILEVTVVTVPVDPDRKAWTDVRVNDIVKVEVRVSDIRNLLDNPNAVHCTPDGLAISAVFPPAIPGSDQCPGAIHVVLVRPY